MPNYQHDKTLDGGQVRLFTIVQDDSDDKLAIDLNTYELSKQENQYEALSYAWCSTQLTNVIVCNGAILMVTASLYGALSQFRKDKIRTLMWVDAICIHQSNAEEKTEQVRNMSDIFSSANLVRIWLGPDELGTSESGLQILGQIDHILLQAEKDAERSDTEGDYEVFQSAGLPDIESSDWRAVGEIFKRPWFGRLWIVRELLVAKRTELHIGPIRADINDLFRAAGRLSSSDMVSRILQPDELESLFRYVFRLSTLLKTMKNGHFEQPLCGLLLLTADFRCSDPRDRFFAVLECFGYANSDLINYEKSLAEVSFDMAVWNIESSDNFSKRHESLFAGLSFVDNSAGFHNDVPSWCISYAGEGKYNAMFAREFRIQNTTQFRGFEIDRKKRLMLHGKCIDIIKQCIELDEAHLDQESPHERAQFYLQYLSDCEHLLTTSLDSLSQAERVTIFLKCISYYPRYSNQVDADHVTILAKSYEAVKTCWQICLLRDFAWKHFRTNSFEAICQTLPVEMANQIYTCTSPDQLETVLHELTDQTWREGRLVKSGIDSAMLWRKFCSTTQERIGWIPWFSRTGDVICMFDGWYVPFVLRPKLVDRERVYQIVGTCYIEGVMYGAVSAINEGSCDSEVLKIV